MANPRLACLAPEPPPLLHPVLSDRPSRLILLEREVEEEYRPQMLDTLQRKVNAVAEEVHVKLPACPQCGQAMGHHNTRSVSWLARCGSLQTSVSRYVARAANAS